MNIYKAYGIAAGAGLLVLSFLVFIMWGADKLLSN